ncbi:hypothetical protein NA56DRAFT_570330, partial [Hyaloscypha hepaticicola]
MPATLTDSRKLTLLYRFKRLSEDPLAIPDQPTFETYMAWYAVNSNGRIGERPTLNTLLWRVGRFGCMYNKSYKDFVVTDDLLDDIRKFVREVLAVEAGIEDTAFEKEYADWKDVEIAIQSLLLHDGHRYRNNRLRAQIICILLLVADDGERIGAIARSEQYRAAERALLYSEIKLFLLPEASPTGEPRFEVEIRYNNRKGESDPNEYLQQTYHQRDDRAHCVVFWIMILALLDDAFQVSLTPEELLTRRNNTGRKLQIPFKQSVRSMPIFRRFGPGGRRELSQSLPWGATCVTAESKRIFAAAGFPQRFTLYNIRRGVNNEISDESVRSQLYNDDKETQKLLQQKRELKQSEDLDGCLKRDMARIERDLNLRRGKLVKEKLKELRAEHFNGAAVLQSLPSIYDDAVTSPEELLLRRPALAAALYPEEGISVSLLKAVQVIIDHC